MNFTKLEIYLKRPLTIDSLEDIANGTLTQVFLWICTFCIAFLNYERVVYIFQNFPVINEVI